MRLVLGSFFLTVLLGGCATTRQQTSDEDHRLPFLCFQDDEAAVARFNEAPQGSQPWVLGGRSPPTSIADLGLNENIRLVAHSFYFDRGSRGYLLCDDAGRFFAFTSPPSREAFFLGRMQLNEPSLMRVPQGSPSYRFLFDLLWSFADDPRYRCDPDILERARESTGLSKEAFQRYLKKPTLSSEEGRSAEERLKPFKKED